MANRRFGYLRAPAILTLGLLASSCARQEEHLIVESAALVEAPCNISTAPGSLRGRGFVDVSFDTGYFAAFTLRNNLVLQGADNSSTGVEPSEMHLTSVDVVLDMPQDPSIISAVAATDPALVEYNQILASSSFNGQDTISTFVEIPAATFDGLRDAISARYTDDVRLTMTMGVTFHALRASNKGVNDFGEVDAREFTLPIEVCFNCLRDCEGCGAGCDTDMDVGASGICGSAQDQSLKPASCPDTMDP